LLHHSFIREYKQRPVPFGWNGLGEVVFYRTYSRTDNPKVDGLESWVDVCERVVGGMYKIQADYCKAAGINWNEDKAQRSAREAFDLMFNLKWSPPGRGLWQAGTAFVEQREVVEGLNNCAFISSKFIDVEKGGFFGWLMEMSMLGVGVGFDTRGAGMVEVVPPDPDACVVVTIGDSREGWATSVQLLTNSYFGGGPTINFDYSKIRAKGMPILGFGGVASGSEPLMALHEQIRAILDRRVGQAIKSRDIVDICNLIGVCVVAGNVRRTALISLGNRGDQDFLSLKDYDLNPERAAFGWTSNNSVFAVPGMDYTPYAEQMYGNGEPGFIWLDNARYYGRLNGLRMDGDQSALGVNPCAEQILHHRELCTLVEIFLPRCKNKSEFFRAIKYAYLYGKSVTLLSEKISDPTSRDVMVNNRRIGLSVTGITQFLARHGYDTLIDWLDHGYATADYYDQLYSQWLGVNQSVRKTSVKPSGSISLVAGVTPGIHFNQANRYHIRRVVLADDSHLIDPLAAAGYHIEPSSYDPSSVVVAFPLDAGPGVKSENEVSMTDQLDLVSTVQKFWADNSISCTIKFDPTKESPDGIAEALSRYDTQLKTISFLPLSGEAYEQPPYEDITADEYHKMAANLKPFSINELGKGDKQMDLYCEGDACEVELL